MQGERIEIAAYSEDCAAYSSRLAAPDPQKCWARPDGGVVTQRTANPQSRLENQPKFARFPVCSRHGVPPSRDGGCALLQVLL